MTIPRRDGAGRYARAIEQHWERCRQRAVVLSPREWRLISEWYARGIPLQLIVEAIDAAFEVRRGRPRQEPRSLSFVAPAVEESWRVLCDGRLASGPEPARQDDAPRDAWRRRRDAEPDGSRLRELLETLLAGRSCAPPVPEADAVLDRELTSIVEPALLREAAIRVDRRIEPFRARMRPQDLERVRARALVAELRLRLQLPRLV